MGVVYEAEDLDLGRHVALTPRARRPKQADVAISLMARAKIVAIAVPSLCEFVWVLRSVYRFHSSEIAKAIRTLLAAENLETNRQAIESGLAILDVGGILPMG